MARKTRTTLTPRQALSAAVQYMDKGIPVRVIADLLGVSEGTVTNTVTPVLTACGFKQTEIKRRESDDPQANLL
jgi:transposase-like protein